MPSEINVCMGLPKGAVRLVHSTAFLCKLPAAVRRIEINKLIETSMISVKS
jgi:hypothetical protein